MIGKYVSPEASSFYSKFLPSGRELLSENVLIGFETTYKVISNAYNNGLISRKQLIAEFKDFTNNIKDAISLAKNELNKLESIIDLPEDINTVEYYDYESELDFSDDYVEEYDPDFFGDDLENELANL